VLAIKNFGHFWSREKVFWGRPKLEGHLKPIGGAAAEQARGGVERHEGVSAICRRAYSHGARREVSRDRSAFAEDGKNIGATQVGAHL
jgi:hypothetical protein